MPERNLDFDTVIDRRDTDCLKYDFAKRRGLPEDVLPLWVADMDFRTSSYVEDALIERARQGIFGYTDHRESYFEAVSGWMKRHHGWDVREEWMIKTPGVVFALAMAVKAFSKPGDHVLLQQPVYYPFTEVIRDNGRCPVSSDLTLGEDNRYHIDFDDFEKKIEEHDVRLFLLCSPHNPVGRVWTEDELRKVGEICLRHGVVVVSDEIHSDFIFEGSHHVFSTLSPEFERNCVICTAPSKTFNLAGMLQSNIFIPDQKLRAKFREQMNAAGISQISAFGLVACREAYTRGEEWYEAMMKYVKSNIDYVYEYAEKHFRDGEGRKLISVVHLEGTYLMWLDFRGTGLAPDQIDDRIVHGAKLWLDSGKVFGKAGRGFERINVACPRATVTEAMERIRRAFCV